MPQETVIDALTGDSVVREFEWASDELQRNLNLWRGFARCSPMQGKLALGQAEWAKIEAYRATATWAEQIVIDSAQEWRRNSQDIQFFGYLLGYSDDQMDALFAAAMSITT